MTSGAVIAATMNTYSQLLRDPRWQKLRLEVLSLHKWACDVCGETQSTLHVHHRNYLKGRNPWEYECDQLAVLCEECHSDKHKSDDPITIASSYAKDFGEFDRVSTASLIWGYLGRDMTNDAVGDPSAYLCGEIARHLQKKPVTELISILDGVRSDAK